MANDTLIQQKSNPAKTRMVSARDAEILVKLGRWQYHTTALEGGSPAHPSGVQFASPAAAEAAGDLQADAFAGRTGSGRGGMFTKSDVLAIQAERAAPPAPAEPTSEPAE